jgi:starch synthase
MRVLFLSVEVEPLAKVGGLADVIGSLPKALAGLGHDPRIVMPAYGMVLSDTKRDVRAVRKQFPVVLNPKTTLLADLYETEVDGIQVWLIDGDEFFSGVSKSQEVYTPGRDAYLFFSLAALVACELEGWLPDVVHSHDWHTGFAPVYVRERMPGWESVATCHTIHNLAYQGEFGKDTLAAAGLPERLWNPSQLEFFGGVNFLKSACAFADKVNTVSPTYAQEIQTEEYGCGLWGTMRHLAQEGRLCGILNGIDTVHHDPATDPRLPFHFTANDLSGKANCRQALCAEAGLDASPSTLVMGVVSRLSDQKGFDLIIQAAEAMLTLDTALVVLGTGDPWAAGELRRLEAKHPTRVRLFERYDAPLAQRIYGGADAFLMPSSFEPCGLGQMFAMRYGTVPIVRNTGGLADTVFEGENGFVLQGRSSAELTAAVARAVMAFRDSDQWTALVRNGMTADHSWHDRAPLYVRMYEEAVRQRRDGFSPASAASS